MSVFQHGDRLPISPQLRVEEVVFSSTDLLITSGRFGPRAVDNASKRFIPSETNGINNRMAFLRSNMSTQYSVAWGDFGEFAHCAICVPHVKETLRPWMDSASPCSHLLVSTMHNWVEVLIQPHWASTHTYSIPPPWCNQWKALDGPVISERCKTCRFINSSFS